MNRVTLPNDLRSCRDLAPVLPEAVGLTEGALTAFSIEQEASFQKCNKRLEAVVEILER